MNSPQTPFRRVLVALTAAAGLLFACGENPGPEASKPPAEELVGLFALDPGQCAGAAPSGSHFRMIQPGGTPAAGPFVTNGDSSCADPTVTPLTPGSDGGLRTGAHQPAPSPAFDDGGNALSGAIAAPAKWFAVSFGLASNPVDPQTGLEVAPPRLRLAGGELTGDLRSLAASWNGQEFNQGAPKPDGGLPGNSTPASGTFDEDSRRYTLDWSSQIVGGPFDNFTGIWHLEGTFTPDP